MKVALSAKTERICRRVSQVEAKASRYFLSSGVSNSLVCSAFSTEFEAFSAVQSSSASPGAITFKAAATKLLVFDTCLFFVAVLIFCHLFLHGSIVSTLLLLRNSSLASLAALHLIFLSGVQFHLMRCCRWCHCYLLEQTC